MYIIVTSYIINTGISKDLLATEEVVVAGKVSLLYCAPEAVIGTEKWRSLILLPSVKQRVVAIAIDEAHCVSKW